MLFYYLFNRCAHGLQTACAVQSFHVVTPYSLQTVHVFFFRKIGYMQCVFSGQYVFLHSQFHIRVLVVLVFPYKAYVAEFLTLGYFRTSYFMTAPYHSPGKCQYAIFLFYFISDPFPQSLRSSDKVPYNIWRFRIQSLLYCYFSFFHLVYGVGCFLQNILHLTCLWCKNNIFDIYNNKKWKNILQFNKIVLPLHSQKRKAG